MFQAVLEQRAYLPCYLLGNNVIPMLIGVYSVAEQFSALIDGAGIVQIHPSSSIA